MGGMTDLAPTPLRYREDGWTPSVQARFLEVLAERGSVRHACLAVGRCTASAYRRRAHPGHEPFRNAWAEAVAHGYENLRDVAFDRIVDGESEPIVANGEVRGYTRKFDNRLLMHMLNHLHRVSQPPAAAAPAPDPHAEAAAAREQALVAEARLARAQLLNINEHHFRTRAQEVRAHTTALDRDDRAEYWLECERDSREPSPWCRLSADLRTGTAVAALMSGVDPDPGPSP